MARRALYRPIGDQTFLADLDPDGLIDAMDLLVIRRKLGTVFAG